MKYIRKFENHINKIEVGDYVLIKSSSNLYDVRTFINSNIGRVIGYNKGNYTDVTVGYNKGNYTDVTVEYENIPNDIVFLFYNGKTRAFNNKQIVSFGKTKKELEEKLSAKKYNL